MACVLSVSLGEEPGIPAPALDLWALSGATVPPGRGLRLTQSFLHSFIRWHLLRTYCVQAHEIGLLSSSTRGSVQLRHQDTQCGRSERGVRNATEATEGFTGEDVCLGP